MKFIIANVYDRLLNFIVDTLICAVLAFIVIRLLKQNSHNLTSLMVVCLAVYFSYYFLLESLFQITVGKLVTKTKIADNITLFQPSLLKILIRTLSRFIPFEFVSFFYIKNNLFLHDKISGTTLLKEPKKVEV